MSQRVCGVEFISLDGAPPGALDAARRRIGPMVAAWAAYPAVSGLDLMWLAIWCYLQGTVDGYDVRERQYAAEAGDADVHLP